MVFLSLKEKVINLYDKNYKILAIVMTLILILSIAFLGFKYLATGEFVGKGVSLKGGTSVTIPVPGGFSFAEFESSIKDKFGSFNVNVRSIANKGVITEVIVEASDVSSTEILSSIENNGIPIVEGSYSVEVTDPVLGSQFFKQTVAALLMAFVMMAVVVFITFRVWVPSSFVILAAAADLIETLAVVSLLDVRLSTAGIAGFLMLIGYSVDTDILLTARVLRGANGSVLSRIIDAMRTGLTMSITSLVAIVAALIFTQSEVIRQIMLILFIGILFDIFNTWFQNAGILRWYLERKGKV